MTLDPIAAPDDAGDTRTDDVVRDVTVLDDLELGPRVAEWLARAS